MDAPGSIFLKRDRYYWCVKFPGDSKAKTIALKPVGSQQATKDKKIAEEVAKILWRKATTAGNKSDNNDTRICSIIAKYVEYANGYYSSTGAYGVRWATSYLNQWYGTLSSDDLDH